MTRATSIPDPKIALWALNYAFPVDGPRQWLDHLAARMDEAATEGCDLLALPEYTSAHWLHWAAGPLSGKALMHWMADAGAAMLAPMEELVRSKKVGLISCAPHRQDRGDVVNRCSILLPQAQSEVRRLYHDKLVATPSEQPHGDWPIACGRSIAVFEWRGWKMATLICLDVEMPAVVARLQQEAIDLLIVPSMTSYLSGYRRVFDCAKAAAIQLFAAVAAVGGYGEAAWGLGPNCSGAALFAPCEQALGSEGRIASIGPFTDEPGPGPLLMATAPVTRIRSLRAQGPEAWPGPFPADGITIENWR